MLLCAVKSKKARLLKLTDKVSQLKFIGKKGVERLEGENILSVKDFLDRLSSNPFGLQKVYLLCSKHNAVTHNLA